MNSTRRTAVVKAAKLISTGACTQRHHQTFLTTHHGMRLRWSLDVDTAHADATVEVWSPTDMRWSQVWKTDPMHVVSAYAPSNANKRASWQTLLDVAAAKADVILGGAK
jgi:hypothetical protein